jgi:hypothetical protein
MSDPDCIGVNGMPYYCYNTLLLLYWVGSTCDERSTKDVLFNSL